MLIEQMTENQVKNDKRNNKANVWQSLDSQFLISELLACSVSDSSHSLRILI